MQIIIAIGIVLGVIFWHTGMVFRQLGRMPYVFGFDFFSLVQNFIVIPASLLHTFGLKVGGIAYVAGLLAAPFLCAHITTPIVLSATNENAHSVLALFSIMFWINVALGVIGFFAI